MPQFKVIAAYSSYSTAIIEADDVEQAYKMAKDMDGIDFKPSNELIDWHIHEVTEIE